ncbi:MAG: hypothetical protein JKY22_07255 [Flavobacteriaceae bacterium]|nr:hypothetical protein [Flavobacteriaceae bacterium]
MNTQTYTNLLANPSSINKEQLGDLTMVIEKYPYFQSARALQLKGLKNENSFLYNDALKLTAAYTTDRDILFEYITSETFVQNQISEMILQQSDAVQNIKVVSESISEQVSLEIDRQLKTEIKKAEAILNPDLFERKIESVVQISTIPSEETKEEIEPTETVENAKTNLKIDAPLSFTKKDTHTFGEWLKLTHANPIVREETSINSEEKSIDTSQKEKNRKFELIEKFIQDRPKLSPSFNRRIISL